MILTPGVAGQERQNENNREIIVTTLQELEFELELEVTVHAFDSQHCGVRSGHRKQ